MATNKSQAETSEAPQLATLEELQAKHGTSAAIFTGLMAAQGWKPGKQVTEDAYKQAVSDFLGSPIDGRKVKSNA